jgi:hypothetical protein
MPVIARRVCRLACFVPLDGRCARDGAITGIVTAVVLLALGTIARARRLTKAHRH